MRVSNACNTDFRLFIVLGDEFNIQHLALFLVLKGKCDWILEKPPSTHNYKSLEILILII